MLKKICSYVGCNAVIPATDTYCDKHKNSYNHDIRRGIDHSLDEFYHSREWKYLQPEIIQHYHGLDVYSYIVLHKVVKATVAHHIIEVREDFSRRLDRSNLIPVSASVHESVIRKMYNDNKQRAQSLLFSCLREFNNRFSDP